MQRIKKSDIPKDGCLNGCVAHILGLPLSRVPRLDKCRDGREQQRLLKRFARKHGYFTLELDDDFEGHIPIPHIAAGPTKGGHHAVVVRGRRIIFNPEPSCVPKKITERVLILKRT